MMDEGVPHYYCQDGQGRRLAERLQPHSKRVCKPSAQVAMTAVGRHTILAGLAHNAQV